MFWHRGPDPTVPRSRCNSLDVCVPVSNFSYTWDTAEIHTRTKYKAGTGKEISADIGVHIGLRGINITLKGTVMK